MLYLILINLILLIPESRPPSNATSQFQSNDFVNVDSLVKGDLSIGEKGSIEIIFRIREGYHIQADEVLDDNLIPASITVNSPENIIVDDPVFPEASLFHLKDVKNAMKVFYKNLKVTLPIYVAGKTVSGKYALSGFLRYQACDSIKCYFPRNLPFEIEIVVR